MANDRKKLLLGPISPAAPGALYQQIVDGLKREISEGRLKPGEPLPSFRALAEDLLVSLITVKRAYEELERRGSSTGGRAWARLSPNRGATAAARPSWGKRRSYCARLSAKRRRLASNRRRFWNWPKTF